jgi:septum formation protein
MMMRRIAGRVHEVLTGVSLRRGRFELGRVETTRVHVAPLSEEDIAWYVATGEGRDKAGAYAIQGFASRFIPRIEGSYSNVVGLPVACVRDLLTEISGTPPGRSSPRR